MSFLILTLCFGTCAVRSRTPVHYVENGTASVFCSTETCLFLENTEFGVNIRVPQDASCACNTAACTELVCAHNLFAVEIVTETPTTVPTTTAPTTSAPTTSAPATSAPATSAPTTSFSPTSAPATSFSPTSAPATSFSPTSTPATSFSPTFAPTTSFSPTSTPVTSSPTTSAPTPASPTTIPTSVAPTHSIFNVTSVGPIAIAQTSGSTASASINYVVVGIVVACAVLCVGGIAYHYHRSTPTTVVLSEPATLPPLSPPMPESDEPFYETPTRQTFVNALYGPAPFYDNIIDE